VNRELTTEQIDVLTRALWVYRNTPEKMTASQREFMASVAHSWGRFSRIGYKTTPRKFRMIEDVAELYVGGIHDARSSRADAAGG